MSIEKMQLVNIAGLVKDLDAALIRCSDSGCFHIESAGRLAGEKQGFSSLKEENPYTVTLKHLTGIAAANGIILNTEPPKEGETDDGLMVISDYLNKVGKKLADVTDRMKKASEEVSQGESLLTQLEHLNGLNIDISRINSCQHITVRFGKMPLESYQKLSYYNDKLFMFIDYDHDGEYYWGAAFAPDSFASEMDDILESLYFEHVDFPDFVYGNADDAVDSIKHSLQDAKDCLKNCTDEKEQIIKQEQRKFDRYFTILKAEHDNFELRSKASVVNGKFYIVGFVPESEAERFVALFDDLESVSVVLKPADIDGRIKPPVKLKNNKFSEPFSMFVEMYGLPSYDGINPTMFVAVSYTLLFGIMFGDVGQGLVVAVLGHLWYKLKGSKLGHVMTRLGISSMIFGFLYGSVFGYEHLLDPVYKAIGLQHKPLEVLENTNTILYGAIAIGIALIVISIIFNIITGFKQKDYERALFANNGFAGLVFFGSILFALVYMILTGKSLFHAAYVLGLIVLPLVVMFFREPLGGLLKGKKFEIHGSIVDFIASNFFECFEFLLGYATNTISFVRVGGFVLSHAGMMAVVMALANGANAGASVIIVVIGNIFVMVLEGMLVGIQVLRLEFYEMFSRFYDGDGKPFEPVKVKYDEKIE